MADPIPNWIQYEFDKVYTLHEMWIWNSNQAIESFLGFGVKDAIIEEARDKANQEANNIVENAKVRIENEKMAAMTDLKNQIAALSIDIAEKILERELAGESKQEDYFKKLIGKTTLN